MDDLLDLEWSTKSAGPAPTRQGREGGSSIASVQPRRGLMSDLSAGFNEAGGSSSSPSPLLWSGNTNPLVPISAPRTDQLQALNHRVATSAPQRTNGTAAYLAPLSGKASPAVATKDAFADLTGFGTSTDKAHISTLEHRANNSSYNRNGTRRNTALGAHNSAIIDFGLLESSSTSTRVEDDPFDLSVLSNHMEKTKRAVQDDRARPIAESSRRTIAPKSSQNGKSSAPPPHIVGQLVEMGFSPEDALEALGQSGHDEHGDWNIAAAAESLIKKAETSNSLERQELEKRPQRPLTGPMATARQRRPSYEDGSKAKGDVIETYRIEADELMREAKKIGVNMLSQANTYWKSGKAAAQKAWEEQRRIMRDKEGRQSPAKGNGKPKWMTEAGLGVSDSDEEDKPDIRSEAPKYRSETTERPPSPPHSLVDSQRTFQERGGFPVDSDPQIMDTEAPLRPSRHAHSRAATAGRNIGPSSSGPPPAPLRTLVNASGDITERMEAYRSKGNAAWKTGQYGEAATFYSHAIDILPHGHIQIITLRNNRAAAALKNGDAKGAVEDCKYILQQIGQDLRPVETVSSGERIELSLLDQKAKALARQAQAYEILENWTQAGASWLELSATANGPLAVQANAGLSRCRLMQSGTGERVQPIRHPINGTPVVVKTAAARPSTPGTAVDRMRRERSLVESEEIQRMALKDVVDMKIKTWRQGKETNIRALLSSLDLVLWPELGWKAVGLGELITPPKIKISYMKAIAKVHPDKLDGKSSLEQRMISAAVFAALNEAWDFFKTQNGL